MQALCEASGGTRTQAESRRNGIGVSGEMGNGGVGREDTEAGKMGCM